MDTAPAPVVLQTLTTLGSASRKRARPPSAVARGASAQPASWVPLGTLIESTLPSLGVEPMPGAGAPTAPPLSLPSPLPSVASDCASWRVDPWLASAVRGEGVAAFFPVQRALIPLLAAADASGDPLVCDVCVTAPTGSGKTLAYAVPLLQAALRARGGGGGGGGGAPALRRALHALVVLPTRDLAAQVHGVLSRLAAAAGGGGVLRVAAAAGNSPFAEEAAALSAPGGVDVLVACPGRLMEHLDGTSALARALPSLRLLVVDEADRLLSESYQGWVRRVSAAVFSAAPAGGGRAALAAWGGDGSDNAASATVPLPPPPPPPLRPWRTLLGRTWQGEGGALRTVVTPLAEAAPLQAVGALGVPLPAWLSMALAPAPGATAPGAAAIPADPLPLPFRRVICSATLTSNPQKLAALGLRYPLFVSAAGPGGDAPGAPPEGGGDVGAARARYTLPRSLHQAFVVCSAAEKLVALLHLLRLLEGQGAGVEAVGLRALVFTNSVDTAHRLARLLQLFGGLRGAVVEFSAALPQAKRAAVLAACAEGAVSVLVASDAAARGLDLPALPAVVHYDAPARAKTYVHRVGRAARAGRAGVSYALLRSPQVRHFSALLARTHGSPPAKKETLPRVLVADAAPRLQACLAALRGVLELERAGAQPLLRPVEPLSGTAGGQGGSAAGNDAAAEELLPEA
jgi:ATP-dependent RNA helicase DDX51/DBP6